MSVNQVLPWGTWRTSANDPPPLTSSQNTAKSSSMKQIITKISTKPNVGHNRARSSQRCNRIDPAKHKSLCYTFWSRSLNQTIGNACMKLINVRLQTVLAINPIISLNARVTQCAGKLLVAGAGSRGIVATAAGAVVQTDGRVTVDSTPACCAHIARFPNPMR